jgi:hypothetical protein
MKNILLITDRKAGHENISKGIITEIKKYKDINIIEVEAKLYLSCFKQILKQLINKTKFWYKKLWLIKLFYKNLELPIEEMNYDLIISTGGTTSFLNIMLGKYFDCPNIYCSSLRGLNHKHFTHIVSLEKHNYKNEIIVELAPLNITYNIENIQKFKEQYNISDSDSIISVLIGAKTEYYPFKDYEIIDMIKSIVFLSEQYNKTVLITTSRRTSINVEKELQKITKLNKTVKKCVCYNIQAEKVVNTFLYLSDIVFVTEDSGSMISEALLSKKRVYTIKTKLSKPKGIYKRFIKRLQDNSRLISLDINQIKDINFNEKILEIEEIPSYRVYKKIEYLL